MRKQLYIFGIEIIISVTSIVRVLNLIQVPPLTNNHYHIDCSPTNSDDEVYIFSANDLPQMKYFTLILYPYRFCSVKNVFYRAILRMRRSVTMRSVERRAKEMGA